MIRIVYSVLIFLLTFEFSGFALCDDLSPDTVLIMTCKASDVGSYLTPDAGLIVPVCGYADDSGWHSSLNIVPLDSLQGSGVRLTKEDYETLAGFIVFLFVMSIAAKFILRTMDSSASKYG